MKNISALLLCSLWSAALSAAPPAAHRSREILRLYGGEAHKVPKGHVVAILGNAALVLGDKLAIQKVFRFEPLHPAGLGAPDHVEVVDLDADGEAEILLIGKPTFVVDLKGEPKFHVADRCDEVHLYKHATEGKQLILCAVANRVEVTRWDGQRLWDMAFPKRKQIPTKFGFRDFDGDGQLDVEFELARSKKTVFRVAGAAGRSIGDYSDREAPYEDAGAKRSKLFQEALASRFDVDLAGDGKPWRLVIDKGDLKLLDQDDGLRGSFAFSGGKLNGLVVTDISGAGKKQIVVAIGQKVVVLDDALKEVDAAIIDPRQVVRTTTVKVEAIHFQGFADTGAIQKIVFERIDEVKRCYDARLKKDGVARQGKLMIEGGVARDGSVTKVEKVFNALQYEDFEGCVLGRVKRWRLPAPKDGSGSFSASFLFQWRDELKGGKK